MKSVVQDGIDDNTWSCETEKPWIWQNDVFTIGCDSDVFGITRLSFRKFKKLHPLFGVQMKRGDTVTNYHAIGEAQSGSPRHFFE